MAGMTRQGSVDSNPIGADTRTIGCNDGRIKPAKFALAELTGFVVVVVVAMVCSPVDVMQESQP